ncbi:hypothetical protein V3C99_002811 [Haemonchus contortus]
MEITSTYLIFLLILVLVECHDIYDAETCGLPGAAFAKPRIKRDPLAIEDDSEYYPHYSDDYVLNDNGTDVLDDPNDPMEKMVMGGEKVSLGELPWSARLEMSHGGRMVICGGTLVTRRHLITAAHCFWNNPGTDGCSIKDMLPIKYVRKNGMATVGAICRAESNSAKCSGEEAGTKLRIKNAFYERFFKEGCTGSSDFAFLELERDVPKGIYHACLPHMHNVDDLDLRTAKLFSSGWGINPLKGYTDYPSPTLQKIDLGMMLTDEECMTEDVQTVQDIFCTAEYSEKNLCIGDSGSGVTFSLNGRYYLAGVVSRGSNCLGLIQGVKPVGQTHLNLAYHTADIDTLLGMRIEDRRTEWENTN